jgi:hypothetical protein
VADKLHPVTGEPLAPLPDTVPVPCSVCGRIVETVAPGSLPSVRCLEHSPEFWKEAE